MCSLFLKKICKRQVTNFGRYFLKALFISAFEILLLLTMFWLPVRFRIVFKILIITFKAIHGQAPDYNPSLYGLRSNSQVLLVPPSTKTKKTFGDRAFIAAAPPHWYKLPCAIREEVGGTLLFQCNYDLKLLDLKNLSVFYKNVLAVWQELNSKDPRNANEFKQEIIWNNRFIKIDGKSFYYKAWANKGILKISDLPDIHGQFLSFENFKCKFGVRCTFLDYAGVLAAIPKIWKSEIVGNVANGDNEPVPSLDISSAKKLA